MTNNASNTGWPPAPIATDEADRLLQPILQTMEAQLREAVETYLVKKLDPQGYLAATDRIIEQAADEIVSRLFVRGIR